MYLNDAKVECCTSFRNSCHRNVAQNVRTSTGVKSEPLLLNSFVGTEMQSASQADLKDEVSSLCSSISGTYDIAQNTAPHHTASIVVRVSHASQTILACKSLLLITPMSNIQLCARILQNSFFFRSVAGQCCSAVAFLHQQTPPIIHQGPPAHCNPPQYMHVCFVIALAWLFPFG